MCHIQQHPENFQFSHFFFRVVEIKGFFCKNRISYYSYTAYHPLANKTFKKNCIHYNFHTQRYIMFDDRQTDDEE